MPDFAGVDAGAATGAVTVGEGVLAGSGDVAEAAAGWLTVSSGVGVAEAFAACLRARADVRAGRAVSAVVGSLSDDVLTLALGGGAGADGATTVCGVVVTGAAAGGAGATGVVGAASGVLTAASGGAVGATAACGVVVTGAAAGGAGATWVAGAASGALLTGAGVTAVAGGVVACAPGAGAAATGAVLDGSVLLFGVCANPSATSKAGRTISRNTLFMESSKEFRLAAVRNFVWDLLCF
jgi:hypothetical protein